MKFFSLVFRNFLTGNSKRNLFSFCRTLVTLTLLSFFLQNCSDSNSSEERSTDPVDRAALLTHWADNIIIPAYEHYLTTLEELTTAKEAFVANPQEPQLEDLRSAWLDAYLAWQAVSMFEIGKAESIGLRNYTNIFPTDTDLIQSNIENGNYNLQLPSNFDAQGFPAMDYLLFGLADSNTDLLTTLSENNYLAYLSDLVDRLQSLTREVVNDWNSGYRDEFISKDGSSATSSVDKLVNDYLFYYEKYFRAGKIGIPAGVFSGTPSSLNVEAPYAGEVAGALFEAAFDAVQDFFNGRSFGTTTSGASLSSYLEELGNAALARSINEQWAVARTAAGVLNPDFRQQIETDNSKMLQTFDELQKVVVLLKVDMMQAMNIRVDFVDADGD